MQGLWITWVFQGSCGYILTPTPPTGRLLTLYAKTYVSAEKAPPQPSPWFSGTPTPTEWPECASPPSRQRPQETLNLTVLPRSRRIHHARDYRTMWKVGRTVRGRFIVARVLPPRQAEARFGCVVSSSVAKQAVVRNLIKRRLRSIAAITPRQHDVVIYATKATAKAAFQDLQQDFRDILAAAYAPPHRRRH